MYLPNLYGCESGRHNSKQWFSTRLGRVTSMWLPGYMHHTQFHFSGGHYSVHVWVNELHTQYLQDTPHKEASSNVSILTLNDNQLFHDDFFLVTMAMGSMSYFSLNPLAVSLPSHSAQSINHIPISNTHTHTMHKSRGGEVTVQYIQPTLLCTQKALPHSKYYTHLQSLPIIPIDNDSLIQHRSPEGPSVATPTQLRTCPTPLHFAMNGEQLNNGKLTSEGWHEGIPHLYTPWGPEFPVELKNARWCTSGKVLLKY